MQEKKLEKHPPPPMTSKLQNTLTEIERKLLQAHEEERKREEILAVEIIKENSKYFFSYANKRTRNMSSVGPLEDNDQLECEPEKIA